MSFRYPLLLRQLLCWVGGWRGKQNFPLPHPFKGGSWQSAYPGDSNCYRNECGLILANKMREMLAGGSRKEGS